MFLLSSMAFYDLNTIYLYIHKSILSYIFFFCRAMRSCLRVICRSISDQKSVSFCWATFCPRRRGFRFANDPQCLLYYYYYHQLPQNSTSSVPSPPLNNISWGHIFCGFFPIFFFFSIFRPEQSTAMTVSRSANEEDDRTSIWYVPISTYYTIIIHLGTVISEHCQLRAQVSAIPDAQCIYII